jgi:hypothetical protein
MRAPDVLMLVLLPLAACAPLPASDDAFPAPELLPMSQILAAVQTDPMTDEAAVLQAEADALRAKAEAQR